MFVTDVLIGTYRVQALSVGVQRALANLCGLAPSYITDMLQPVTTLDRQVTLRSADNNDLFIIIARSSDSESKLPLYFTDVSYNLCFLSLTALSQTSENRHP